MNDMERRNFEDSFQKALQNAEVQPSERVWADIELDLLKADGERMKRRVFYYQLVAAAAIALAIVFAGLGLFVFNENQTLQIALQTQQESQQEESASKTTEQDLAEASGNHNSSGDGSSDHAAGSDHSLSSRIAAERSGGHESEVSRPDATHAIADGQPEGKYNSISPAREGLNGLTFHGLTFRELAAEDNALSTRTSSPPKLESEVGNTAMVQDDNLSLDAVDEKYAHSEELHRRSRLLPPLVSERNPELVFEKEEEVVVADPVALMFARLNDLERELAEESMRREERNAREKLWTSVGFAAGAFNANGPGTRSTSPQPSSNFSLLNTPNASVVQNQTSASGLSYSVGLSVGTQVASRWVVQGGVNYLTEMSDYTATQAVEQSGNFKAASINHVRSGEAAMDASEKFVPTAPYTVNNSNEYISIPLQAGYLVVKRKLVWQLNAGVSTDLFIQNTVDPKGNIAKSTTSAGDQSPFRTVNFSGLIGSELSYRFGDHYRLGINPGIRYPFNSVYKDDVGVESLPLTFDVGLRFRYIFQ